MMANLIFFFFIMPLFVAESPRHIIFDYLKKHSQNSVSQCYFCEFLLAAFLRLSSGLAFYGEPVQQMDMADWKPIKG